MNVSVTTPGGSDTLASSYTYLAAPTLVSLNPDRSVPRPGGTTVILTGTGLTGTTAVTFDGVPATGFVVVSDTEVTVDTPAHAAGLVDVELTTPGRHRNAHGWLRLPALEQAESVTGSPCRDLTRSLR